MLAVLSAAGCARQPSVQASRVSVPTTGPATWSIDEIGPPPSFPVAATRATDDPAPLDAIVLFAQARARAQGGDRAGSVALLRQAVRLDPGSFELQYELGTQLRQGLGYQPEALAAFEAAAAIDPDRLDVHLDIARQLLARGDRAGAVDRLRIAIQTTQYTAGDLRSAEADFLLAHALRELGYDRASLDRFELLLGRLTRGEIDRSHEVARLLNTRLFMQIGDLYLKRDRPTDALRAYRTAEGTIDGASDIDVKGRVVRALMLDGQVAEGMARAADVVRQFGASPTAMSLLRDVYTAIGRPEGVNAALLDLHRQFPDDRLLLFALCEVLAADGHYEQAEEKLTVAWQRSPGQPTLLVRWFGLRFDRDPASAVRLLADVLSETPAVAGQIEAVWQKLASPDGRAALPLDELAAMKAPSRTRAAQAYIVYRVARQWPRAGLARRSLDAALAARSTSGGPVFVPAYVARADELLDESGPPSRVPRHARLTAAADLAASAEAAGDPGLADFIRGRIALARGETAEAATCFASAAMRHPTLPEPRLGAAQVSAAIGETTRAVELAWDVVRAFPEFEPSYAFLDEYPDRTNPDEVFAAWKAVQPPGEPGNPELAVLQAEDQVARGHIDGATLLLSPLERHAPADPRLLDVQRRVDAAVAHGAPASVDTPVFQARLEKLLALHSKLGPPGLTEVAVRLSAIYERAGLREQARHVRALARSAAGREPDLLYRLALSAQVGGDDSAAESWLQAVLEVDPNHGPAAESLSALWAASGRFLENAERFARLAAAQTPADPVSRGNVGWVLYRAGRLTEARDELLAAIRLGDDPARPAVIPVVDPGAAKPLAHPPADGRVDPVLLDRAGDVLYRLGDRQTAAELWERAQRRLGDADVATADRADIQALRQSLPRKLQQHRTGQEVPVSTTAGKND